MYHLLIPWLKVIVDCDAKLQIHKKIHSRLKRKFHYILIEQYVEGPWIFGPIDFLKIAKTENTFPLQFLMTVELGNRRTTSFNESEAGPLVIRQIRLCRRGASVTPRPRRLALCPCATATTLWTAQLVG